MGVQESRGPGLLCELLETRRLQDCMEAIQAGTDINDAGARGKTPLRLALDLGEVQVFRTLLARDAQLLPQLEEGETFLHIAAAHGHYALAKDILRDSASFPKIKNARNAAGQTALHLAVLCANAEMVALLLKYNCDSSVRDRDGFTPRDLAVTSSSPLAFELVEQLSAEDVMDKAQFASKTKTSPHAPPEIDPQTLLQKRDSPAGKEHVSKTGGSTQGSKSTLKIREDGREKDEMDDTLEEVPQELACDPLETIASSLDEEIRDSGIPVIKGTDLQFGEMINRGSSCEVIKASWRGCEVAVKQFKQEYKENPKEMSKFIKEMQTLAHIRHPNLILLMGICTDLPNLCLITEYVPNMSLFYALHSNSYAENKAYRLTLQDRFSIAVQVCKGLSYLHACDPPIVHRDLKPENCLLDHSMNVKIADFGLARPLTCFSNEEALTTTCIGTTRFMAPELFEKEKVACIGTEVDVWALGCLFIELFSNKRPWDYISTVNVNCIYYEVSSRQIFKRKPIPVPEGIPEEVRDIIRDCCQYSPKKRPAVSTVFEQLQAAYRLYV